MNMQAFLEKIKCYLSFQKFRITIQKKDFGDYFC